MSSLEKLQQRWVEVDNVIGVGLDPRLEAIPEQYYTYSGEALDEQSTVFNFCKAVIDATGDLAVDYKANSHFFRRAAGKAALHDLAQYIHEQTPRALFVVDGKFGEVGHSTDEIVDEVFGYYQADATLVNPYLGSDAVLPFSRQQDKLTVVCVKTSNPSSPEIQDARLADGRKLWQVVLESALGPWNEHGNIIPVLSATYPDDLKDIRQVIGQSPILIGGIGTQNGDLKTTLESCMDDDGYGLLISASRKIIYPSQELGESHQDAVRRVLQELITDYRQTREQVQGA